MLHQFRFSSWKSIMKYVYWRWDSPVYYSGKLAVGIVSLSRFGVSLFKCGVVEVRRWHLVAYRGGNNQFSSVRPLFSRLDQFTLALPINLRLKHFPPNKTTNPSSSAAIELLKLNSQTHLCSTSGLRGNQQGGDESEKNWI